MMAFAIVSLSALSQDSTEKKYGSSLISIMPFSGYASAEADDIMVGLAYEHFLNEYVSIKVPVKYGLVNDSFQAMISAKFYTSGHEAPVTYAIGPALVFTRSSDDELYNLGSVPFDPVYDKSTVTQVGFMLMNSLNVTIQKNVYLGVDIGLGLNYLNRIEPASGPDYNADPDASFDFDISLGYRF